MERSAGSSASWQAYPAKARRYRGKHGLVRPCHRKNGRKKPPSDAPSKFRINPPTKPPRTKRWYSPISQSFHRPYEVALESHDPLPLQSVKFWAFPARAAVRSCAPLPNRPVVSYSLSSAQDVHFKSIGRPGTRTEKPLLRPGLPQESKRVPPLRSTMVARAQPVVKPLELFGEKLSEQ